MCELHPVQAKLASALLTFLNHSLSYVTALPRRKQTLLILPHHTDSHFNKVKKINKYRKRLYFVLHAACICIFSNIFYVNCECGL